MDWGSLIGLALALTAILAGQALEGGSVGSLVQPAAFVIVFLGTMGAVLLQSKLDHFILGVKMLRWIFVPPENDKQALSRKISMWTMLVRKEGILRLESQMSSEQDPFIKKGLRLMIDGTPAEKIQEICHIDLDHYEANLRNAAKIWDSAGGYAPTIGIIGAVLGLIHVMENLSDPDMLGSGIAVAFVATIYGVGFANLVFLPIAYKLRNHIQTEVTRREMLVDALVAIANGDHPRLLADRLAGYTS
ncbi:Chemotaxis protein PomA [Methylophilaceae bacterium]|nr:Chemotaxis protein PomA [Methylophilaceae bacterium]